MIELLIKFCVVGFSGLCVDFGSTFLVKEKLRINKYVANSVGFILAATSNYILNRIWTFESHTDDIGYQYSMFFGIAIVGLGINNAIIYVLSDRLHLNFYLSKLLAIGIVTLWNFFMNYFITFR